MKIIREILLSIGAMLLIAYIFIIIIMIFTCCSTISPDFPGYSNHNKSKAINYKPIKKYKKCNFY